MLPPAPPVTGRFSVLRGALLLVMTMLAGGSLPIASAQTAPAAAAATSLAPMVVAVDRSPTALDALPVRVDMFSSDRIQGAPGSTLDATLRESAAFSLFRRSGSLTANPTAQGVSLRGLGPSGASRSLVLLDGVPLNDPFGGWIAWGKLARLSLAGAEVVHGGGSGTWGNAALGGTVALFSQAPSTSGGGIVSTSYGSFSTWQVELSTSVPLSRGALRFDAAVVESDGFYVIAPGQRGPVDQPLDTRQRLGQLAWSLPVSPTVNATLTGRAFSETRGNGTPLQRNASEEGFFSLALDGHPDATRHWSATAYVQYQEFESFFSSVDTRRTTETPANDQFSVRSRAAGASFTHTWIHASPGAPRTGVGADVRWVEGETREDFLLTAGRFTRRRFAGGEQAFAGLFASHDRALAGALRGSVALRFDGWTLRDGHRREIDLGTQLPTRDDRFEDRDGSTFSPRLGLSLPLSPGLRCRAATYRAFRVPTLNEFHRPFRVGNINTEANPALRDETVTSFETGLDFDRGGLHLSGTLFTHDLDDAIANVTLSRTPTLVSRQRRNLDAVRVRGLEVSARWTPLAGVTAFVDLLWNDARVREAREQPSLTGTRLAQVPRQTVTAGLSWKAPSDFTIEARARWVGEQFEDDENTLRLAAATVVDLRVSRRLTAWLDGFVAGENLGSARVETGRSTEGLVTLDAPRRLRLGLQAHW
ncbi:MAG: TonB-dependent receptor [Opitutaceae bacterium]|nr:TonB-dependent receptor [Opitutaceae bacterium]